VTTADLLLARPTDSPRYIVYCRAYAVASAIHLTLPDALDDPRWWPANAAYWLGALLVAVRGNAAGWMLCAIGLAVPLVLYEDQLTQSVYLLSCALGALACFPGRSADRTERMSRGVPAVVRALTVGTYALAAFHKLNRDFLDPDVSCANAGVSVLADNWAIDALAAPSLAPVWPHVFLLAEVAVVGLLVVRPAWGMALALLMHIPLTIVFAPSFAFVMISGWVCLLTERDLAHLAATLRAKLGFVVGLGVGLGVASFVLYMQRHWVVYAFWSIKEAILWIALVWLCFAIVRREEGVLSWWSAWAERPPRSLRWAPAIAAALFVAHGVLPYTGLKFHHSGAMLSNLRIDRGCWNHLIVPESARAIEPYVRIDEAEPGDVAGREELSAQILGGLYGLGQLRHASRSWCASGAAPLRAAGTYEGRAFRTDDLCSDWPLPEPTLPGLRRFQANLARDCPQLCIH
jgi:hypothetical protein